MAVAKEHNGLSVSFGQVEPHSYAGSTLMESRCNEYTSKQESGMGCTGNLSPRIVFGLQPPSHPPLFDINPVGFSESRKLPGPPGDSERMSAAASGGPSV